MSRCLILPGVESETMDMSNYRPQFTKSTSRQFSPRKAVRTFRDLDIYQATIQCAALITKDFMPNLVRQKYPFAERMHEAALAACDEAERLSREANEPLGIARKWRLADFCFQSE
jgi:hypothetical protein